MTPQARVHDEHTVPKIPNTGGSPALVTQRERPGERARARERERERADEKGGRERTLTRSTLNLWIADEALRTPADGAVFAHVAEGVGCAGVVQDARVHAVLVDAGFRVAALVVGRALGVGGLGYGGFPPALHEGVANVARGTLAARLMVLSHADGVQATRVGAAHVHAGAFPTVFVVGAVLVNAALRFDRAWSDADAILDQDLVGRTLANHGSERHSVDHAALLGRQAGVSERAGILAYGVDAGVLRGAVGVSAALGLHRGLRYGRLLHLEALEVWVAREWRWAYAHGCVVGGAALGLHGARGGFAHGDTDSVEAVAGLIVGAVLAGGASHRHASHTGVALHTRRAIALGTVQHGSALGVETAGGAAVRARVYTVLADTRLVRGTVLVHQAIGLEALDLGVARPSLGARAGWAVLLGPAEGVAAARVLHQARVHADLVDARLVRRAVGVGAAGGLQRRNQVAVHVRVACVSGRARTLGPTVEDLALGIGRARVEDGTGVEALSVAANLGRATLVIGSTAWGFCRAWRALDVGVSDEAREALARHGSVGQGVDDLALGVDPAGLDHEARVVAAAVEARQLARAVAVGLALLEGRFADGSQRALDDGVALVAW